MFRISSTFRDTGYAAPLVLMPLDLIFIVCFTNMYSINHFVITVSFKVKSGNKFMLILCECRSQTTSLHNLQANVYCHFLRIKGISDKNHMERLVKNAFGLHNSQLQQQLL